MSFSSHQCKSKWGLAQCFNTLFFSISLPKRRSCGVACSSCPASLEWRVFLFHILLLCLLAVIVCLEWIAAIPSSIQNPVCIEYLLLGLCLLKSPSCHQAPAGEGTPEQRSWPAASDTSVQALQRWPQTRPSLAVQGRLGHAQHQKCETTVPLCYCLITLIFLIPHKAQLPTSHGKISLLLLPRAVKVITLNRDTF